MLEGLAGRSKNIIDILKFRAETQSTQNAYIFLEEGEREKDLLSYEQLDKRAQLIAGALQQTLSVGDRVLLCYSQGLEFICAFLACLYAGVIAVPAYPLRSNHHAKRLLTIINDCNASLILGTSESLKAMLAAEDFVHCKFMLTETLAENAIAHFKMPSIKPDMTAFLQYTSGSTAAPKGVMITHQNIMANQKAIFKLFNSSDQYTLVSWLPMQHDMGLVGNMLATLYCGANEVMMSPASFIENPLRWLKVISHYKAYAAGGPNFGYQLCIDKITPEQTAGLDLSSWQTAFNGSEPIRAKTLVQFAEKFSHCGFKAQAFLPCYGLAETTLLVSGKDKSDNPIITPINREKLTEGVFEIQTDGAVESVSTGRVFDDFTVKIVNPTSLDLAADNEVGEIWVHGPSVAKGYWNNTEITDEIFRARLPKDKREYLRTGDLGCIVAEQLYVTGRLKDMIILQGRNLYPHDIEAAVEASSTAIRQGCSAAFSIDVNQQAQLVIVAEIERVHRKDDFAPIFSAIRRAVAEQVEAIPYSIHLLKPAHALKTTSGKIQRQATKAAYLKGELDTLAYDDLIVAQQQTLNLEKISDDIASMLSKILAISVDTIDRQKTFSVLGGTSLEAVMFHQQLQTYVGPGIVLSPTIAFDYSTVALLAQHLYQTLRGEKPNPIAVRNETMNFEDPIAIIGMACRFPGNANSLETLWELLNSGSDGIVMIPTSRFDIVAAYEEDVDAAKLITVKKAGLIEDIDKFDADFFGITPREAETMDPQQRLLLETTWHALENSGIDARGLKNTDSGVFVGATTHEYSDELVKSNSRDMYMATGNANSVLSGRLSYVLGLQGPSITVDTACSSSLVALHQACNSLHLNESQLAIVAGVNALLSPDTFVTLSKAGMLAPDGKCKVFSEEANGYVRGEGCGVVVLKRLSKAKKDNNRILSIIKSTVVNQDGASSGLTVPNGVSQQNLLRKALVQAKLEPKDIDYIETHGSGTPLGDPMETHAITKVYENSHSLENPLKLGSVKANVGHLEAAAGMVGLIKTVLCLQHELVPPQLFQEKPNPKINLDTIPGMISAKAVSWKRSERARRAGVSSFGFSGTNAHVILEEAPQQNPNQIRAALPLTLFKRQRYWAESLLISKRQNNNDVVLHPLLGIELPTAANSTDIVYEQDINLNADAFAYFSDHKIYNQVIFPGAAYVELMLGALRLSESAANTQYIDLTEIQIVSPLKIDSQNGVRLQVIVTAKAEGNKHVSVYSQSSGKEQPEDKQWVLHASGQGCSVKQFETLETVSFDEIKLRCVQSVDITSFYKNLATQGLQYGNAFQAIQSIYYGDNEVLAKVYSDTAIDKRYEIYPAVLDACLQALSCLDKNNVDVYLPTGIQHFILCQKITGSCYVHGVLNSEESGFITADFIILNETAEVLARIEGFTAKRVSKSTVLQLLRQGAGLEAWCYEPVWKAYLTNVHENANENNGLIFDVREHAAGAPIESAIALLCFLQDVIQNKADAKKINIITEHAYALNEEPINLNHACLNGFIKTAILEYPGLNIRQIDIEADANIQDLLALIQDERSESIFMIRNHDWYVQRLQTATQAENKHNRMLLPVGPYRLSKDPSGLIQDLRLRPNDEYWVPSEHEVVIEPKAVGLNFRDVLNVMNLYPGDPGALGGDCAGVVKAVGSKVKSYKVGDAVLGLAQGSLASCARTHESLIAFLPKGLSFAEAAAIPTVFMTAYYSLIKLAKLKSGETVLIHAGSGGVGLAAIQIAHYLKAKVIATAGSGAKRTYLKQLKVEHVFDSRSLHYQEDIERITQKKGVQVVLNSLSGDGFIEASLACCARQARFIEIGKRAIFTHEQVANIRPDIEYKIVSIDAMAIENPKIYQTIFSEVINLIEDKVFKPIPQTTFPLTESKAAFQYLQQAKQIGKVVITLPETELHFKTDASYLITGGLGGIGLELAKYLSEKGAGRIILAARRKPDANAALVIAELRANHTDVISVQADISNQKEIDALIKISHKNGKPLIGIFHAAGIIEDALIEAQNQQSFEKMFAAKAQAAWYLHEKTLDQNIVLDYFVLFSSIASLNGSASQSNYAVANSFLDALALYRRQHKLNAISLNWGPWRDVGMAKDLVTMHHRHGLTPFKTEDAIAALDYALKQDCAELGLMQVNWHLMSDAFPILPSWLNDLTQKKQATALVQQLQSIDPQERAVLLNAAIIAEIKMTLGYADNQMVDESKGFFEMGMDSLMALELKNRLQVLLGKSLSNTLAFDYPTLDKLVPYLLENLQLGEKKLASALPAVSGNLAEPIAIIGLNCRFPGGASNPEKFWELLEQGFDSSIEIPKSRWNIDDYFDENASIPGKIISRKSSFLLEPIGDFDATFFGISPREAEYLDPQQRLLLEVTWHALEQAGIKPRDLSDSQTGVFIGISTSDYAALLNQSSQAEEIDPYFGTGNAMSAATGRISYTLGLRGPCMAIETACSSSLVALHQACQSLRLGESSLVITGGVNVLLSPNLSINFSQAHMLSPDGHCKAFDKSADGYVRGEGCGIVILKRLSDAKRDNDRVLAVIKGSAVNQDGASSGLTVPNGPAQEEVMKLALANAQLQPDQIDYIEAHGTGTALGDPIEVNAIYNVFGADKENNQRKRALTIGTVKTNIGHLEAAAGIAGLIKTVLSLQHESIPKHLHYHERNPQMIDFAAIPAQIPTQAIEWKKQANHVRRAGISSFGFSGTNAHVILEEAPEQDENQMRAAFSLTVFNRQRYWAEVLNKSKDQKHISIVVHPLLGVAHLKAANSDDQIFEQVLHLRTEALSYLSEYQMYNQVIFPSTIYVELMLSALKLAKPDLSKRHIDLNDIQIILPLKMGDDTGVRLQVIVTPNLDGSQRVAVYSQAIQNDELEPNDWMMHASGQGILTNHFGVLETLVFEEIKARCVQSMDSVDFYKTLALQGAEYGRAFQCIQSIQYSNNECFAKVEMGIDLDKRYQLYPVALEACLQLLACFSKNTSDALLFTGLKHFILYQQVMGPCYIHGVVHSQADAHPDLLIAEFSILNESAEVLAKIEGFAVKCFSKSNVLELVRYGAGLHTWCYQPIWQTYTGGVIKNPIVENISQQNVLIYDARQYAFQTPLENATSLLAFLQDIVQNKTDVQKINIITEHAYSLNDEAININHACLNGFIKTAILEYPVLNIKQIDIGSGDIEQNVWLQIQDDISESIFMLRNQSWYVQRLQRAKQVATEHLSNNNDEIQLKANSSYLITGGLGGVGLEVAKYLSEKGARRIVLVARRNPDIKAESVIAAIRANNTEVVCVQADVSKPEEVNSLIRVCHQKNRPLCGVFHAAGTLEDALIAQQTQTSFENVFAAKAQGAWYLHEKIQANNIVLDYFVLFSSVASLNGSPSQSNYAVANGFLDALAILRQQQNLKVMSLNWGPWREVGMAKDLVSIHRRQGVIPFKTTDAIAILDYALKQDETLLGLMQVNWNKLSESLPIVPSWLQALVENKADSDFVKQLASIASEQRTAFISAAVADEVRKVLGLSTRDLFDYDKNFLEMGMDSLMAISLNSQLKNLLGSKISIPDGFIAENQTLSSLITATERLLTQNASVVLLPIKTENSTRFENRSDYAKFEYYQDYIELKSQLIKSATLSEQPLVLDLTDGIASNTIQSNHKEMIHFSGYNYLGMSGDPFVSKAAFEAIQLYGTSVSASRLASGDKPLHRSLEKALAEFVGGEDAIVFTAGFLTNATVISYLFGQQDMIVVDSLAHNSIVYGCNASGSAQYIFPHNNLELLEDLLEKNRDQYKRVLIVIEGVYSMDGDIPNLPKYIELKKKYDAFLMIDEAHSAGTIGKTGRGIGEYHDTNPADVDIWMGTLSKSFASCGGYIVGSKSLITLLKYKSSGFVYSCGITPANTAAALAAISLSLQEPHRVKVLQHNADFFRDLLREQGINIGLSCDSPVVPIIIGDSEAAVAFSAALRERNIYCHPVIYPFVKRNEARLRLFINCKHTEDQLQFAAENIGELYRMFSQLPLLSNS